MDYCWSSVQKVKGHQQPRQLSSKSALEQGTSPTAAAVDKHEEECVNETSGVRPDVQLLSSPGQRLGTDAGH